MRTFSCLTKLMEWDLRDKDSLLRVFLVEFKRPGETIIVKSTNHQPHCFSVSGNSTREPQGIGYGHVQNCICHFYIVAGLPPTLARATEYTSRRCSGGRECILWMMEERWIGMEVVEWSDFLRRRAYSLPQGNKWSLFSTNEATSGI